MLCVVAVLAADTGASVGATGGPYQPAAAFADTEYEVPFYGRLWDDKDPILTLAAVATNRANYFAQVTVAERDGSSLDLSFAVEGQSEGPLHQACEPDEGCNEVTVQVTPDGVLYLYWPQGSQPVRQVTPDGALYLYRPRGSQPVLPVNDTYFGGFGSRAVELSAADADSGLKVYREVAVDPPTEAADCEDYGGGTPEAFTCLYLRQLLPPGQAADLDEAALRAELPKLVQDSANYRLAFAEEFNGTPPAADANGCSDGLSTLDADLWSYYNACDDVDSKGEPCGNVADGGLTMGIFSSCGPYGIVGFLLGTHGHLHMKYGYIEVGYSFNIDQWRDVYHNYNMILNVSRDGLHYLRNQHGVELENWEDYLKSSQVEIDIFELPRSETVNIQYDVFHQYANWHADTADVPVAVWPTASSKFTQYCDRPNRVFGARQLGVVRNSKSCRNRDTIRVTKGLEWTPRGYRTYIQVHNPRYGMTELTLVPKDQITIRQRVLGSPTHTVRWFPAHRDPFFEYLEYTEVNGEEVPDLSTLLEQIGVSHIPMPIFLNVWGWLERPEEGEPGEQPYIRRRMTFDYVRVWQPENHYADMEPVYQ